MAGTLKSIFLNLFVLDQTIPHLALLLSLPHSFTDLFT